MTIGENIRRIRKERGLTLKQLGEAVGVSEAYIRAYESGRRNPKQKSLEALASALHVNVEALTGADFDGVKAMHRLFQVFSIPVTDMKSFKSPSTSPVFLFVPQKGRYLSRYPTRIAP